MAGTTEVSIWVTELQAGTLPPVCVKSGKAADSWLTFGFGTSSQWAWFFFGGLAALAGPRGHLPVTRRWRLTFIVFRAVAITLAGLAVVAIFSSGAVPETWRPGWVGFAFGSFAAYVVAHTLYAGLRPKGFVQSREADQPWIHLVNVHPNFVAAVEAMSR